jgi:predicted alpha/beta superfamily hydrolase
MKAVSKVSALVMFFLSAGLVSLSQINVTWKLTDLSKKHSTNKIFIAGSFNMWRPADTGYSSVQSGDDRVITVSLPQGAYEYKFTRGGWEKVEVTTNGADVSNRQIRLHKDTVIEVSIGGWRDDFPVSREPVKSTASVNVKIVDTLLVPQLNRKKAIRVYVPLGYATSTNRYPVIYMHDAQNLFDRKTSAFGEEWGVDEALDSLIAKGSNAAIIIGIDNDAVKRLNEYNPYDHPNYGKGEGDRYLEFIVSTLKPYVDRNFRTLPGKKNTFIAGSSMGGLISMYAVLKHPNVFGGAGVFSPAFWIAKGIDSDVNKLGKKLRTKVWFYAGGKEGESMVPDMRRVKSAFDKVSRAKTTELIDEAAGHNESAWREYFPAFYNWILGD